MKPAALLAPATLLLASPAVALDCKVCGGGNGGGIGPVFEVSSIANREWFAECYTPAGDSFVSAIEFEMFRERRFEGSICFQTSERAGCRELSGTLSAGGQVEIVADQGPDLLRMNLDLDSSLREMVGTLQFASPGEMFAECYVSVVED